MQEFQIKVCVKGTTDVVVWYSVLYSNSRPAVVVFEPSVDKCYTLSAEAFLEGPKSIHIGENLEQQIEEMIHANMKCKVISETFPLYEVLFLRQRQTA